MAFRLLPLFYLGVTTMVTIVCLCMVGFAVGLVGFYKLGRHS
jgi:hypothetical protein